LANPRCDMVSTSKHRLRRSRRPLAWARSVGLQAAFAVGALTACSGSAPVLFSPPGGDGASTESGAAGIGGAVSLDPSVARGGSGTQRVADGGSTDPGPGRAGTTAGGGGQPGAGFGAADAPEASAGAANAGGVDSAGGQQPRDEPGAGGRAVLGRTCANEVVLESPLVANFNDSDPKLNVFDIRFAFDAAGTPSTFAITSYTDGSGSYAVNLVDDGQGGYALQAENLLASKWGGGAKVALPCLDARQFTGLSFRIKGFTPHGDVEVSLTIGSGEYVGYSFAVPLLWTKLKVPFTALHGVGDSPVSLSTQGASITEITFSAQLNYAPSGMAIPGAFEMTIDDLGFY